MGQTAAPKKPRNWRPWVEAGVADAFQHRGVIFVVSEYDQEGVAGLVGFWSGGSCSVSVVDVFF